jgi:protein gp37
MGDTNIAWATKSWNPTSGCTAVSPACDRCYAKRMATRLAGRCGYPADDPFRVTVHEDKLDDLKTWRKPQRVFVVSMGDLFHDDVSNDYIGRIWWRMAACPRHSYLLLTKRPARLRDWTFWWADRREIAPENVWDHNHWLGVTAENQEMADSRIPMLFRTPAYHHWVSVEPMLEQMTLSAYVGKLGWVVVGCESGAPHRPMSEAWVRGLRDECEAYAVPFFYKQQYLPNGSLDHEPQLDGVVWRQFPSGMAGV